MSGALTARDEAGEIAGPRDGLAHGTWLGKHQLIRRLAVGGMAEIYLARATGIEQFEKLVVLKRMLPHHADDHRFIRMFLDEARLAATFSHPNIAHVYDIGSKDGHYYFTMEYVHGVDLATLLRMQRALPLAHALTIVAGVAAGLHAAHETRSSDGALLGVVHRDVSPSNVLVGFDGSVKVVDFGIARVAAQRGATRPGGFMGKVRYASPEHVAGEALDRRSDVYALGVVLYELICGARPFDGDNELAVMRAIDAGAVPASPVLASAPGLEAVVMRAMARDRGARFATAQAMQLALEAVVREAGAMLSTLALADFMRGLYGDEVAAWDAAQRAGRTLTEHVMSTGGTESLGTASLRAPALSRGTEVLAPVALQVAPPRVRALRRWRAVGAGLAIAGGLAAWWRAVHDAPPPVIAPPVIAPPVIAPPTVTPVAAPVAPPSQVAAQLTAHGSRVLDGAARGIATGARRAAARPVRAMPPPSTRPTKTWDPDSPFEP